MVSGGKSDTKDGLGKGAGGGIWEGSVWTRNSGVGGMEGAQSGKESGRPKAQSCVGTRRWVGPVRRLWTKCCFRSCQGLARVPTQQARARINRHHTLGPPTFPLRF